MVRYVHHLEDGPAVAGRGGEEAGSQGIAGKCAKSYPARPAYALTVAGEPRERNPELKPFYLNCYQIPADNLSAVIRAPRFLQVRHALILSCLALI